MKQIQLSQGRVALVDDEDFEKLNQYKWCANKIRKTYYATTYWGIKKSGSYGHLTMHRLILNITDGKILIDHRDNNGLNNQKKNLRIATTSQNAMNSGANKSGTSKYKGVSRASRGESWQARISKGGKHEYLGYFSNENDAAIAYNKAAIQLHGEFANPNVI